MTHHDNFNYIKLKVDYDIQNITTSHPKYVFWEMIIYVFVRGHSTQMSDWWATRAEGARTSGHVS